MGGNGNSHSILVKIDGQNGMVKGLFPVQDRRDLGWFAQFLHQLGTHCGSKYRMKKSFRKGNLYNRAGSSLPAFGMETHSGCY